LCDQLPILRAAENWPYASFDQRFTEHILVVIPFALICRQFGGSTCTYDIVERMLICDIPALDVWVRKTESDMFRWHDYVRRPYLLPLPGPCPDLILKLSLALVPSPAVTVNRDHEDNIWAGQLVGPLFHKTLELLVNPGSGFRDTSLAPEPSLPNARIFGDPVYKCPDETLLSYILEERDNSYVSLHSRLFLSCPQEPDLCAFF